VRQLVKIDVVAEKLSVSVATVKELVRDGQIPVVRFSRKRWRFDPEEGGRGRRQVGNSPEVID
jgi:excisionase family DNA binding protein